MFLSIYKLESLCNTTEENTTQSQCTMTFSVRQWHTTSNVHYLFLVTTQILISVVERTSESSRQIPFRYYPNQYAQCTRGATPQRWRECNYCYKDNSQTLTAKLWYIFVQLRPSMRLSDCAGANTLSYFRKLSGENRLRALHIGFLTHAQTWSSSLYYWII